MKAMKMFSRLFMHSSIHIISERIEKKEKNKEKRKQCVSLQSTWI